MKGGRNYGTDSSQPRRRARLRAGVMAAAVAGIAVLAACGGSPPATAGQTVYQEELAYAQCMRGHGDPGFPDPQSNGAFTSTKANHGAFSGPRFLSANKACAHLEGHGLSPVQFRQTAGDALKFVACMRAHGIVNFPDPRIDWHTHMIRVGFTPSSGIDPNSPQFKSAQKACQNYLPPRAWVAVDRERHHLAGPDSWRSLVAQPTRPGTATG
jgi:hypothetical protein